MLNNTLKGENPFFFTERIIGFDSDNKIFYYAGPIHIGISCWSEKIYIKTNDQWKILIPYFIEACKGAWEVIDSQIIFVSDTEIEISLNYKTLKLYIEHSICYEN